MRPYLDRDTGELHNVSRCKDCASPPEFREFNREARQVQRYVGAIKRFYRTGELYIVKGE